MSQDIQLTVDGWVNNLLAEQQPSHVSYGGRYISSFVTDSSGYSTDVNEPWRELMGNVNHLLQTNQGIDRGQKKEPQKYVIAALEKVCRASKHRYGTSYFPTPE